MSSQLWQTPRAVPFQPRKHGIDMEPQHVTRLQERRWHRVNRYTVIAQHALNPRQHALRSGHVLHHVGGEHQVELAGGERLVNLFGVADPVYSLWRVLVLEDLVRKSVTTRKST